MQENSNTTKEPGHHSSQEKALTNQEEDGRNKEWQDRARVNLEEVPEGTHTSVERDFEPENPNEEEKKKKGEKDGSEY